MATIIQGKMREESANSQGGCCTVSTTVHMYNRIPIWEQNYHKLTTFSAVRGSLCLLPFCKIL